MKLSKRYSLESLITNSEDSQGTLFVTQGHGVIDLSNVDIVGASVDTVRQLYYGIPDIEFMTYLDDVIKNGDDIISILDVTGSTKWHVTKMGKAARYRYKLQNNEVGLVVLYGAYNVKLDKPGQHLKFELSPHFIADNSDVRISSILHFYAGKMLDKIEPRGCAVHLACDFQGYALPQDFINHFTTYTRTVRNFDGIGTIDLSDLSESIASYGGKGQSKNYLIGKANAIQLCIYHKDYEAVKSDKIDYFNRKWGEYSLGVHNPDKPTWRIEVRIHHQIIREFGEFLGKPLESFFDVMPYLTDIWRYALSKNRFNLDTAGKHLHPFWQLLMEDVFFTPPSENRHLKTPLARKKKQSVSPISKNISLVIGNLITIYARQNLTLKQVLSQLRLLTFYPQILDYYKSRNLTESDFRQSVEKSLALRRLLKDAA